MRRGGARPPLLCGGGSCSQRSARCGRWRRALSACGRRRGRRVLRGGRRRTALAAPLHAAPLVCCTRPPCRRIRCGVVALGRRSSAAAARALSAVRVVVGGGARSLRAAVDEVVAFFGAAAVALLSRRRSTRRRSCALRARRAAASDAAWWRSAAAPLRRRLALSARCASWSVAARALCVRSSTRSSRSFGAAAIALLSRRRSTRRRSCALRARRAAASDAAWWRSAAAPLRRRLALSARCASWSVAARALCVRPSTRSSRPSWRSPSRCSRGAAPRGAARVLHAPAVPPYPMRRGGPRPPLLCGGGSRSQRGARRGRWRRALSACGRRRGRRVLRGGRRRAALAAPLHAAPLVCSTRLPCRRIRCGVVALGRRSSAAAARALSAVRVVVGGCARSLRAAVDEVVASFGAAAIALLSRRRSTRRRSCALRARRAAASDAAWWRSAAAPLRRRLALSAWCASWSVAARALCVRSSTRSSRSSGRPPSRCSRGAAPRGAARVLYAPAVPPHPMRRGGARPPLLCGGGSCSQRGARRGRWLLALSACGRRRGRRVLRGGRHRAALAAPLHAAPLVCSTRPPCRRIRCGVVALGRRSSAAAARALSAVRVVVGGCARSLRAAVDEVVASFGAAAIALLSRRRSTRRRSCALRARRAAASDAAWWRSAAAPLRRRLALSARCASWSVAARALCVRPSTRSSRSSGRPPSRCSRGAAPRGAARVLYAPAVPPHPMRRGGARPPLLCGGGSCSQRGARRGRWLRALSACGRRRGVASFGAAAIALLSRRRSTRRRSCALRARRAAASDAAWWRSAAAPLRRRLALSAWCASWSVAARALCVRSSTRSSRSSGRPPSRCSRGAAPRGAARVLYAPAVPPHPMRRGGARPPLLCGGGSCSQRGARRGRWLLALSACGRRRGRRVLRGGRHRAALAAPHHATPAASRRLIPPARPLACASRRRRRLRRVRPRRKPNLMHAWRSERATRFRSAPAPPSPRQAPPRRRRRRLWPPPRHPLVNGAPRAPRTLSLPTHEVTPRPASCLHGASPSWVTPPDVPLQTTSGVPLVRRPIVVAQGAPPPVPGGHHASAPPPWRFPQLAFSVTGTSHSTFPSRTRRVPPDVPLQNTSGVPLVRRPIVVAQGAPPPSRGGTTPRLHRLGVFLSWPLVPLGRLTRRSPPDHVGCHPTFPSRTRRVSPLFVDLSSSLKGRPPRPGGAPRLGSTALAFSSVGL